MTLISLHTLQDFEKKKQYQPKKWVGVELINVEIKETKDGLWRRIQCTEKQRVIE